MIQKTNNNVVDLSTYLSTIKLENPFVLASGFWGVTDTLLLKAVEAGAGIVTTKSVNTQYRPGHNNPIHFDWGNGLINAVGLPGSGSKKTIQLIQSYKGRTSVPIIASIFGKDVSEFIQAAEDVLQGNPDIIELNMSCPNVGKENEIVFASDALSVEEIVAAVRKVCNKPLFAKLAPNVSDIAAIAKSAVRAGADGITAINTVPGMVLDLTSGKPVLSNKSGGLSGPAIKPIAIKAVYDIRAALPDTPIIGTGGVLSGQDAAEMLMAGATAVGIGSAVYYRGVDAFSLIKEELIAFMKQHNYETLNDIKGLAHL